MVSYKPEARKDVVVLLSTEHHDDAIPPMGNPKMKPTIVLDYNSRKGGVDAADQLVAEYSCQRPSKRWPMKIFFALLDVAAMNAYKVFIHENPNFGLSRGGTGTPVKSRRLKAYRNLALQLVWPQITARYLATPNLPIGTRNAMKDVGNAIHEALPARARDVPPPRPPPPPRVPGQRTAVGRCFLCPEELVKDRRLSYKNCSFCNRPVCTQHCRDERFCDICTEDVERPVGYVAEDEEN